MRITPVPDSEVTGAVRAIYDRELANRGYIPNFTRLFSLNPAAYEAWGALLVSIRDRMDLRRYELVTLAAASALHSRYCVSAHGAVLESKFYERPELEAITRDYRTAGLDSTDVAIMAFAEKVARNAYEMTSADVDDLRARGLTDAEILDVTLAAAARSFFSKTLDAMGAEPDEALAPTMSLFDLIETPVASQQ